MPMQQNQFWVKPYKNTAEKYNDSPSKDGESLYTLIDPTVQGVANACKFRFIDGPAGGHDEEGNGGASRGQRWLFVCVWIAYEAVSFIKSDPADIDL